MYPILRVNYNPSPYDADWEDIPSSGPFPKWFGGVIVPLVLMALGTICVISGHAVVGGDIPLELHGPNAVALGIAAISIALFFHCHYFWGNIYHLSFLATLGKIISMLAFIGSLGYLLVCVGIFGQS